MSTGVPESVLYNARVKLLREDRVKMVRSREYPERPVVGVGGVVISERRVLLVRRAAPPLEGEWSIPGGMLETGETVLEGVRRELMEETGVEVRVHELIEVFERISLDDGGQARYHYVVLDYFCEPIRGDAFAASDAADVAWVHEDLLGEYALSSAAQRVIQKALGMARERKEMGNQAEDFPGKL